MISASFQGDKITSLSEEAFALHEKSCFGEKKNSKIEYSNHETLFLLENKRISVFYNNLSLPYDKLIKKLKKYDKKLETKYTVYSDLRKKGYILKSALKFGADFRVYDKGVRPSEDHARWLVIALKDSEMLSWSELAGKARVAHSTKKKLLIAVVDDESSVSYYEFNWFRP